jgi:hypothetical protein
MFHEDIRRLVSVLGVGLAAITLVYAALRI